MSHLPFPAVILAGGSARRMGGGDKPLLPLQGRPLLAWIIERLARQTEHIAISANGPPERFASFGLPILPDTLPVDPVTGGRGPMAGVLAALDWLAKEHPGVDYVVTVSGDTPCIPHDMIRRLDFSRAVSNLPMSCTVSHGRLHPTIAFWPITAREVMHRLLPKEESPKVDTWLRRIGCSYAIWLDEGPDPFFNINTPEDLAAAEERARSLLDEAGTG